MISIFLCACTPSLVQDNNENVELEIELPNIEQPSVDTDANTDNTEIDKEEQNQIQTPIEKVKQTSYAVSTANSLKVRSKPSQSSSVLGYLDKNDAVILIEESGNYYKTIYKEKTAYVHKTYCKIMKIDMVDEPAEKAIELGAKLLGHPYVWGSQRYHWGNGKLNSNFKAGEFDCSALVQYVYFKSNGVILDVNTRTQVKNGIEIKKSELKRGDLMFFTNSSRKNLTGTERIGHVGIYFGNNYILHTASDHAVIEPISDARWSYYVTARRVV